MDWLGLAGSGISAIASLFGAGSSAAATERINRENRDFQYKLYKENNEYNTPSNIRSRLEAAGINPALAMQDGAGIIQSDMPSQPNTSVPDYNSIGAGFSQAAALALQSEQVSAQRDLLKSQKTAQDIDNMTKNAKNFQELENLKKDGLVSDETYNELKQRIFFNDALFDVRQKQAYADVMKTQSETAVNNMMELTGYNKDSREWQLLQPTISQLLAGAELSKSQANQLGLLSPEQRRRIGVALVTEAEKRASAEKILGYEFTGESVTAAKKLAKKLAKKYLGVDIE